MVARRSLSPDYPKTKMQEKTRSCASASLKANRPPLALSCGNFARALPTASHPSLERATQHPNDNPPKAFVKGATAPVISTDFKLVRSNNSCYIDGFQTGKVSSVPVKMQMPLVFYLIFSLLSFFSRRSIHYLAIRLRFRCWLPSKALLSSLDISWLVKEPLLGTSSTVSGSAPGLLRKK